jgi:DNA-binding CsgD family transcriptional regulator
MSVAKLVLDYLRVLIWPALVGPRPHRWPVDPPLGRRATHPPIWRRRADTPLGRRPTNQIGSPQCTFHRRSTRCTCRSGRGRSSCSVQQEELAAARALGLTDRELDVLQLLGQGKNNPEIAAALFISPRTAGVHVTHILRKLDATTRVQAATIAERAGLLSAEPTRPGGT